MVQCDARPCLHRTEVFGLDSPLPELWRTITVKVAGQASAGVTWDICPDCGPTIGVAMINAGLR